VAVPVFRGVVSNVVRPMVRDRLCGLVCATALAVPLLMDDTSAQQRQTSAAKTGRCRAEARAILGQAAITIGGKVRAPEKTRDVRPRYPELPGTVGSGHWIGEALIDTKGRIARVWTIREVQLKPPLPAFNRAIVDAIRQWEFEPMIVDRTPVPVCLVITTVIDWE
jgi:hypothetical protein